MTNATTVKSKSYATRTTASEDDALYKKVSWRFIPLLFICYVVNYIDRTNVGYAQLQMQEALKFGDAAFGFGAAIFFIGYAIFEIPSNILLQRVGIKLTLLRIMTLWGIASASTMFVQTPTQFYIIRFLVGVFEAGFFPGVLYFLAQWFPPERRARTNALFFMGFGAAPIVSGPLAGMVMTWMNGLLHLHGWQWLFLIEGIAAVVLGVVAYRWLDESPEDAQWLTPAERDRVDFLVHGSVRQPRAVWTAALREPRTWGLALTGFLVVMGIYAMAFWQPTLLKSTGLSILMVGFVSVAPAIAAVAGALLIGGSSDRRRERRIHFSAAAVVGAVGLAATTAFPNEPFLTVLCLCFATVGTGAAFTILWASSSEVLPQNHLAVGFAFINTCVACGGVVAPILVAKIRASTGEFTYSLLALAAALLFAALVFNVVLRSKSKIR